MQPGYISICIYTTYVQSAPHWLCGYTLALILSPGKKWKRGPPCFSPGSTRQGLGISDFPTQYQTSKPQVRDYPVPSAMLLVKMSHDTWYLVVTTWRQASFCSTGKEGSRLETSPLFFMNSIDFAEPCNLRFGLFILTYLILLAANGTSSTRRDEMPEHYTGKSER